ncbi:MAG: hypothetical protein ACYSTZ_00055 [Planctomycetota bacterium]|jgi:hypothetical protein
MEHGSKKVIHVDKSRKGAYDWENNTTIHNVVRNLASCGLPNEEIANLIGVRLATLQKRIKTVPQLEAALIEGKAHATQIMVGEMYKTAIGGHVYQEITEKINAKGAKTTQIVTKESPPNAMLQMYWLNNRDPENWKTHRQLQQEAKGAQESAHHAESDKIARLSREVFASDTDWVEGEHTVSEETAQPTGEGTEHAEDLSADVQGEATDNIQDMPLDVPTEEGTEPVQTPPV